MRFVSEYRDREAAQGYAKAIDSMCRSSWTIMEVCGGQTHSIVKYGIDGLLPDRIRLVHGPGCPVCVTATELVDRAVALAGMEGTILCSFGDMMRVPGSAGDLLASRAAGADVRMVYSPLDAVTVAEANPDREVIFFAVGFETTAPVTAAAVLLGESRGLGNFSMLTAHVLVPPAITAVMNTPGAQIQGFLAAGHVCAVMGYTEYEPIAESYRIPIVVTGFEPLDILEGIHMCIRQLEQGRHEVENQYRRSVSREGNAEAMALIRKVYMPVDRVWRGIGNIPDSGLDLRPEYSSFDARTRFDVSFVTCPDPSSCIAGSILTGESRPDQCSAFGTDCTPEHPLGAPMVSSEGACAAYYRYRRQA